VKAERNDKAADREISSSLQIERAFSSTESVLLLDEPLAGKPQLWRKFVVDKIQRHKSAGGSVIVVEHNLDSILPAVDRILLLDKGRVKFLGSPHDYSLHVATAKK
jgi:ABC-type branched-subunit amino acid transport system ATPase component